MGQAETDVEYVARGRCFAMALTRKVARAFQKVDVRVRAALERWMKHYANEGPDNLPREILKVEGRFRYAGEEVLILAFRERTTRLYGGQVPAEQMFLVTEIDEKKSRKADQDCLKRAARYLVEYAHARSQGGNR